MFQRSPGKLLQREEKKIWERCQTGDKALCLVTSVFALKLIKSISKKKKWQVKKNLESSCYSTETARIHILVIDRNGDFRIPT